MCLMHLAYRQTSLSTEPMFAMGLSILVPCNAATACTRCMEEAVWRCPP